MKNNNYDFSVGDKVYSKIMEKNLVVCYLLSDSIGCMDIKERIDTPNHYPTYRLDYTDIKKGWVKEDTRESFSYKVSSTRIRIDDLVSNMNKEKISEETKEKGSELIKVFKELKALIEKDLSCCHSIPMTIGTKVYSKSTKKNLVIGNIKGDDFYCIDPFDESSKNQTYFNIFKKDDLKVGWEKQSEKQSKGKEEYSFKSLFDSINNFDVDDMSTLFNELFGSSPKSEKE